MNQNRMALIALAGLAIAAGSAQAQVKIAQLYGGNTTTVGTGNWRYDYVILKNTSNAPVDMSTWSIQYAATTGTSWSRTNLTGSIPANGYFLIQCQGSASGTVLPIAADVSSATINMSATAGKLALIRRQTTILSGTACVVGDPDLEDFLGYSPATTCSETTPSVAGTSTSIIARHLDGCFDTGNNLADFAIRTSTAADFFNSGSPASACSGAAAVNLATTITSTAGTCEVAPGAAATSFTVTVTNLGSTADATNVASTITLPGQFTYTAASGSASQGTFTPGVGSISWNVGTLASGASATLSYTVDIAGSGGATTTAAATATELEVAPSNNSVSMITPIEMTGLPLHTVFLGNQATVPAAKREVSPPSGGTRTWLPTLASAEVFGRMYGSADGNNFVFLTGLDASSTTDNVLIMKGSIAGPTVTLTPVIQKGTTELTPGETVGPTIDNGVGINDSGQIAFSGVSSAGANNDYVARRNADGTMTVIVRENGAFPGSGPATIGANNNYTTGLTNDGRVIVQSVVAGGDTVGTVNDIMMFLTDGTSSTVIGREATAPDIAVGSVPAGEPGTWKTFDSGSIAGAEAGTFITGDGMHIMSSGTINSTGGTATDNVLVRDGVMVIQEGKQMPAPEPFAGGTTASTFNHGYMMDSVGNWICYGSNNVAGQDWVVRNGAVVAKTGDALFSGSSETWSDSTPINPGAAGYADCFFGVTTQGNDYCVEGISTAPYGLRNGVLVWNGQQVLVREGDPVDLDGNGLADDNCFVDVFRNGRMWISSQRVLYVTVTTRSNNCGTVVVSGNCILAINLPSVGNGGCQPADIADDTGEPLPSPNGNTGVNEGDYNAFFAGFFDALPYCDQWDDAGNPLPSAGTNTGVNEGDYNGFFATFFNGCA